MWEYKVREKMNGIDIAGAYGYKNKKSAIQAFKRRFANWRNYACIIYAPGYKPCAQKDVGEKVFS